LILLVVPACTLPLAGVGAILGLVGRTQRESGDLTFLLSFLLMGLGPVIVPPDRLPAIFTILGRLSPATYAASALRQTMVGPVTRQIAIDLAVLAVMTVVCMWLVGLKMNWRQD
jgi:ABC-2 type transport system permease protein